VDLDPISLDLHAAAAAIAALSTSQIVIDPLLIYGEPCRHPLDDGSQPGPMGFTSGQKT
jgi:hypothetical protein